MRVQVMPDESQEVPIDAHGELCAPEDVALGIVVHSRTGSPYDAGHVEAWGDTRVVIEGSQDWRIRADITPVRIRSRHVRRCGEYPREVGMKIIPGRASEFGDKLQVRKLTNTDGKTMLSIFILSGTFTLWGDDNKKYTALLPGPWKDSELVFEADMRA